MKKGGLPAASLPTHPHCAMDTATKAFLRKAVIEAVHNQEDTAAKELFDILAQNLSDNKSALPPLCQESEQLTLEPVNGPARTYRHWSKFIEKHFIPFVVANGRCRFTSVELFSWIEHSSETKMTAGDIALRSDGKQYWRSIVTNALKSLKDCGIIDAEKGGRVYVICNLDNEETNA